MCPDLQLEAAVALGLLFLLFPGDEWNPQPAPAAADMFWKWFSSWLHLVDRVSSKTKHRFLFDTFSCVEVALEGLLQDFFLVSSLSLLQAAHRLLSIPLGENTTHLWNTRASWKPQPHPAASQLGNNSERKFCLLGSDPRNCYWLHISLHHPSL